MTTIYPLSSASIRWLETIFAHPALQKPGGTVVRKISGAPRYVTRTVLASVAKLKGFDVKVHGFLYLISKPDIVAGTLVGTAAQMEAGLMPYMLGKAALRNM